jgi:hypothetical protein
MPNLEVPFGPRQVLREIELEHPLQPLQSSLADVGTGVGASLERGRETTEHRGEGSLPAAPVSLQQLIQFGDEPVEIG